MNIVKVGGNYQIYGEGLQTFKRLPPNTYCVKFSKMQGFFLSERSSLEVKEEKIYGNHNHKVEKVLRSFENFNRNLGVILSGQKGIGKSLFARMLAIKAVEKNIPLIIVDEYNPGISNFINSIEQEVIILFDEFEKTFASNNGGEMSPQAEMLPVFDGMETGKKLFVITCNEVRNLSSYLLNRPGRFHYHFTISTPSSVEIEEYLKDKLKKEYYENIEKIINFSLYTEITYDCLRAICFELNNGYTLQETLNDLNITKMSSPYYNISITLLDGKTIESIRSETIDFFSNAHKRLWAHFSNSESYNISFNPNNAYIHGDEKIITIDPDKIVIVMDDDDNTKVEIKSITFVADNKIDKLRYLV